MGTMLSLLFYNTGIDPAGLDRDTALRMIAMNRRAMIAMNLMKAE